MVTPVVPLSDRLDARLGLTSPTCRALGHTERMLTGAPPPPGFHATSRRERLGDASAFEPTAALLRGWGLHARAGLRPHVSRPGVELGAQIVQYLGWPPVALAAPCRVVWTLDLPDRVGYAYATLPGHPECGEELFQVRRDEREDTWFDLRAFSRPARWFARLAGPAATLVQRRLTDRYVSAARSATQPRL